MSAAPEDRPPSARKDPLLGTVIGGRYRIARVLGQGGMGIVYEGVHEDLHRPVAVKVLAAAYAQDTEAIERFLREARTSSAIGHPNIVHIYDLGRFDDGRPYLVMERLDGIHLGELLHIRGPLSPRHVADLLRDVGSALDAVHAKAVVHRDIKPENLVVVRRPDGVETVKLLDFGLAAFARPGARNSRLTKQGIVHGTPQYLAPEACGGSLPDHRADVYALGVVTFELLTGLVPFDSENPLQILTSKVMQEPPLMKELSGKEFPPKLEGVVHRALARDPNDRYLSAGAFVDALHKAVEEEGRGVAAVTAPPVRRDPDRLPVTEDLPAVAGRPLPAPPRMPRVEGAGAASSDVRDTEPAPRIESGPLVAPTRPVPWIPIGAGLAIVVLIGGIVAAAVGGSEDEGAGADGPVSIRQTAEPAVESPETGAGAGAGAGEVTSEPIVEVAPVVEPAPVAVAVAPTKGVPGRNPRGTGPRGGNPRGTQVAVTPPPPTPTPTPAPPPPDPSPESAQTNAERAISETREGMSNLVRGWLPQAIEHFREATLANPRHAPAWRGLGLANERLRRRPEAVRAYERYLLLAPGAGDAASVRARLDALRAGG